MLVAPCPENTNDDPFHQVHGAQSRRIPQPKLKNISLETLWVNRLITQGWNTHAATQVQFSLGGIYKGAL